jgi:energy-coupling factor transporter ATP-binding protein EcfA2
MRPVVALEKAQLAPGGVPLGEPIDLLVTAGECLLISGPTGSGKSTLLQVLAGLQPPAHGSRRAEGRCGLVLQDPELQLMREHVGPEVALLLEHLCTASEEMRPRVRHALDLVGLDLDFDRRVDQLSQGQLYRLLMAAQLVAEPDALLLDEPWAQLDPDALTILLRLIPELCDRGIAVVIADHHWRDFAGPADRHLKLGPHGLGRATDNAEPVVDLGLAVDGNGGGERVLALRAFELLDHEGHTLLAGRGLELHAGETVSLVGPNGSGKSTLLRALAGLGRRCRGDVEVLGRRPTPDQRGDLGYLLQQPTAQLFAPTVDEEIGFSLERFDRPAARGREVMEGLDLLRFGERSPLTLSFGEQHLVALAGWASLHPRLLMLDDPFAGLDPDCTRRVGRVLNDLVEQGCALIIANHRPIPKLTHRWTIRDGEIRVN